MSASVVPLLVPFNMVVSGMAQSGKSWFIRALIKERNQLFSKPVSNIYYYCGVQQAELAEQPDPEIQCREGIPNLDEITDESLVILDDLLGESSADKVLLGLFTKYSHHRRISVIYVTQHFYYESKVLRVVTRNAHYVVLFRSQRQGAVVAQLSRQLWPNRPLFLPSAYEKATGHKRYSYLFLSLHPAADPKLAVLTNILPSEGHVHVFL